MNAARLCYRSRQFWRYLGAKAPPLDTQQVHSVLGSGPAALFARLSPGEQAHSYQVYWRLVEQGESDPDLLAAALLHDTGKARFPLHLWERVWIVLGMGLFPGFACRWGESWRETDGEPAGFRRAFVVASRHPQWGAELAAKAGAAPRVVALIRRHQEKLAPEGRVLSEEDRLLIKLQSVDDES